MTSATDVLRHLLDERGVEWGNIRNDGLESDYLTEWQFENNRGKAIAIEWAVGSGLSVEIHRYHLTPEQAIAATLCSFNCTNGERTNGTCRNVADDGFECSECKSWWTGPRDTKPPMLWGFKYCPNCGRKVVDE